MRWQSTLLVLILAYSQTPVAFSDELTQIVQQDLTALGYDTGGVDGTATTKTAIAVSRFQAEHNMPVTGEITPQLAGVIKASMSQRGAPASGPQTAMAPAAQPVTAEDPAALKARQEACLQEKVAAAQESARMKSGFSKLLSAVSRTASQYGAGDTAAQISSTTNEATSIDATITDLEGAAKDLGISQSDIDACQNP